MNGVFLDSVGIVALWNERDQWHAAASAAFAELSAERAPLVTTSYIVAECANALSRTAARCQLSTLVEGIDESHGLVIIGEAEWRNAWTRFSQRPPGSPGLVDLLSFDVMHRLALRRAFTCDRHFSVAGFETLF